MKVLKKGAQRGWFVQSVCTGEGQANAGCGAALLVQEEDLFRTEGSPTRHIADCVTFKCVACGALTDLPEGPCPSKVYKRLPSLAAWLKKQRKK